VEKPERSLFNSRVETAPTGKARIRIALPQQALRRSPRPGLSPRQYCSLLDVSKEALGRISKIVVFGQPASLNTIETINPFDRPMAARFPRLCSMQYGELPIRRSIQGTPPIPAVLLSLSAVLRQSYGKYMKARVSPMSRNSASGTREISLRWISRLRKWMKMVMVVAPCHTSKRACVRMTAEWAVHRAFRNLGLARA
jgi:hypothetical protein